LLAIIGLRAGSFATTSMGSFSPHPGDCGTYDGKKMVAVRRFVVRALVAPFGDPLK
jgi:hypothetical protein